MAVFVVFDCAKPFCFDKMQWKRELFEGLSQKCSICNMPRYQFGKFCAVLRSLITFRESAHNFQR